MLGTFVLELAVPPLIFGGRWLRRAACAGIVLLQVLIGGTGNYTFFNLLTVALALLLLDDAVWRRVLSVRVLGRSPPEPAQPPRRATGPVAAIVGLTLLTLSTATLWTTLVPSARLPGLLAAPLELLQPFRSVNDYGLFRVMTTTRAEIVVEGSDDGETWRLYQFKYKPGDILRAPQLVEPHQPRLDWQMWFAALGTFDATPWFQAFLARLLQGSPDVLRLLAVNPFPDHPPRYVREQLYDYRFTNSGERRATGAWWTRRYLGPYSPTLQAIGHKL